MTVRRRLSLQLTPLLDLMLIVMFSQYIENRNRVSTAELELKDVEAELLRRDEELTRQLAEREASLDELRKSYDLKFQSVLDQHQRAAELLAGALDLPAAAVTEILKLRTAGRAEEADRLQQASDEIRRQLTEDGQDVFRFFLQVDEMQKHVTVWEVHLQDNGLARVTDGTTSSIVDFQTATEFETEVFETTKKFADPKTLVVVLLTWGDAQGGARQKASDGIPGLLELLRRNAGGTRWFDFSIVGYRPEGPLFAEPKNAVPAQPGGENQP